MSLKDKLKARTGVETPEKNETYIETETKAEVSEAAVTKTVQDFKTFEILPTVGGIVLRSGERVVAEFVDGKNIVVARTPEILAYFEGNQ